MEKSLSFKTKFSSILVHFLVINCFYFAGKVTRSISQRTKDYKKTALTFPYSMTSEVRRASKAAFTRATFLQRDSKIFYA